MYRMWRIFLVSCAIAAALVAGLARAATPVLTPVQLVAKADAICVRYAPRVASPGKQPQLGQPAWDAAWLRTFDRQHTELAALRPPASRAPRYRAFLGSLPPVRASFRALTSSLEAKRPVRTWVPLVKRLHSAERHAGQRARAVGLRRCFAAALEDEPPSDPKDPKDPKEPRDPNPGKGKPR